MKNDRKYTKIYECQKGKDFVRLSLEHGQVYYEGEVLKGEIEYFSSSNQKPCIYFDFRRTIKYDEDSSILSQLDYLNEMNTTIGSLKNNERNLFSFEIPQGCGNNGSILLQGGEEEIVLIDYVFQIHIFMKKNSLINFFGSIPIHNFESTVNLQIFPVPLVEEIHQEPFEILDDSEDWKDHKFVVKFPKKVFFIGEEFELSFSLKPNQKNKIRSIFIYLYQKVEIFYDENCLDQILDPLLIGSIFVKDKQEFNVKIKIPSNALPNISNNSMEIENFLEISGSLLDYDSKGPSINQDIRISSPLPSKERLISLLKK
jgi:hypothetical protein